jgi:hypothetical protein
MEFLSDNLIFIAFAVIAVVSQIGRLLVKNAERRRREDRGERTEERQEAAVYGGYEYGKDAEDEDEDAGEDEGEAFSAWSLSVDDEPAAALPVSPLPFAAPRPAVALFSAPLPAPLPDPSPFPALIADSAVGAEKNGAEGLFPPSLPNSGPSIDGNGRVKARSSAGLKRSAGFPGKLEYLSPLKRAVVLAEILGPPKGF